MTVFKQIPGELDSFAGDVLLCVVGEDERPLRGANAWVDWRLYGSITELIVRGVFSGKLGEKCLLPTYGKFKFDRLVLVGGGNIFETAEETLSDSSDHWLKISDVLTQTVRSLKVHQIGMSLPRYDLADHERLLIKAISSSQLPSEASLFISRASQYSNLYQSS